MSNLATGRRAVATAFHSSYGHEEIGRSYGMADVALDALAPDLEHLLMPVMGWLRYGPLTDEQRQAAVDKLADAIRLVNPDVLHGHDLLVAPSALVEEVSAP